jgi:hypothetical protein
MEAGVSDSPSMDNTDADREGFGWDCGRGVWSRGLPFHGGWDLGGWDFGERMGFWRARTRMGWRRSGRERAGIAAREESGARTAGSARRGGDLRHDMGGDRADGWGSTARRAEVGSTVSLPSTERERGHRAPPSPELDAAPPPGMGLEASAAMAWSPAPVPWPGTSRQPRASAPAVPACHGRRRCARAVAGVCHTKSWAVMREGGVGCGRGRDAGCARQNGVDAYVTYIISSRDLPLI